jgi:hypothetical protein
MEDQAAHQGFAGELARCAEPGSMVLANRFELLRWDHLLQYAQELRILHRRVSPSWESGASYRVGLKRLDLTYRHCAWM